MSFQFTRKEFSTYTVRMVEVGDNPLFSLADVCTVLGFSNPSAAAVSYCKQPTVQSLPTGSGISVVTVIPYRDVRRLAGLSRAVVRRDFEDWILSDILPQYTANV